MSNEAMREDELERIERNDRAFGDGEIEQAQDIARDRAALIAEVRRMRKATVERAIMIEVEALFPSMRLEDGSFGSVERARLDIVRECEAQASRIGFVTTAALAIAGVLACDAEARRDDPAGVPA